MLRWLAERAHSFDFASAGNCSHSVVQAASGIGCHPELDSYPPIQINTFCQPPEQFHSKWIGHLSQRLHHHASLIRTPVSLHQPGPEIFEINRLIRNHQWIAIFTKALKVIGKAEKVRWCHRASSTDAMNHKRDQPARLMRVSSLSRMTFRTTPEYALNRDNTTGKTRSYSPRYTLTLAISEIRLKRRP